MYLLPPAEWQVIEDALPKDDKLSLLRLKNAAHIVAVREKIDATDYSGSSSSSSSYSSSKIDPQDGSSSPKKPAFGKKRASPVSSPSISALRYRAINKTPEYRAETVPLEHH